MRKHRTDYPLWGLISGSLFVGVGFLGHPDSLWGKLPRVLSRMTRDTAPDIIPEVLIVVLVLAVAAALVGWAIHAVAVMCGVRFGRRADPTQATDYDDAPPAP